MVGAHMAMLFSSSPQLAGDTAADQRLTLMIDGSFLLHFICSFTHRVSEGTSSSTLSPPSIQVGSSTSEIWRTYLGNCKLVPSRFERSLTSTMFIYVHGVQKN